ncbi:MAG TPA: VIT domain-containing protein, partial [Thermoanaerobaculia bacterium]|nr:VIT domain-containing protein [Thermoanaerobaculia bacterium]
MRFAVWILALGLTATTTAAKPRIALPLLTAQDTEGRVSLPIDALRVDVLIRGHLARTTYEITFRNELDRDLDGQFAFPLPPDSEVTDIGLYFDGHLRHAVAVERVQARAAYEQTVHRRVDPALAEWSASTRAFRFRVYPIPAQGRKVVYIAYDQDIASTPYELDLRAGLPLAAFDLTIDSDAEVESDGLALQRSGDRWTLQQRNAPLQAFVRVVRKAEEVALAAWSASEKSWYSTAPLRIRSNAKAMPPASAVTILYDVSSSAVQRDGEKLREFLRTFLAAQHPDARVTVVPFHVLVEPPIETGAVALDQRLAALPHAGATNLVSLIEQLPRILSATPADSRIVLVTDGVQTIGDSRRLTQAIDKLARLARPILVVNASPSVDDTSLARLAAATGGWNIDLTRTGANDAAAGAMRLPVRVSLSPSTPSIRKLLPQSITLTSDATVPVHARGPQRSSWLRLAAGGTYRELPIRELSTDAERDLVRQSWARAELRALLERGAPAEDVLAHGLRFQQLTPQTSLLVLDTWQDYENYGIPLPPDLRVQRAKDISALEERGSMTMHSIAAEGQPDGAGWFIRGTVSDAETPIPGVTVEMLIGDTPAVTVTTDAQGRFWISAQRAPARFTLRVSMEGFETITHLYPTGAPKGAIIDIVLRLQVVMETITVAAESPMAGPESAQVGSSASASLVHPSAEALADSLLAQLVEGMTPNPDEDEEADEEEDEETRFEERIARISAVVDRLRSLTSIDERFRYYIAARSAIGGEKYFQAASALALQADAPELAVRVLTDLAEAYPDDAPTLRLIGRVLDGWGFGDLARLLFERALELSPRETQTWRELLLLAAREQRTADLDEL